MMPTPYQRYQATQVTTAGTGDLIVLLYDGAIRFLARAEAALGERRLDTASADIARGQDIILELITGLDYEQGGQLAGNLRDLYWFMYQTLLQANLENDAQKLQTVIRLLDNVRGAWRTVVRGDATSAALAVAGKGVAA